MTDSSFDRLTFVPVRHHSPACARAVRALALEQRPAAVLIEGPSDFNARLDELALPHQLPIAIYSYVRLADGARRGAFYPFCEHSPEWEGLRVAREIGAQVRFIDLPWADLATARTPAHRYADGELRRSPYIPALCRELGVEDFDSLWDTLVEIDPALTPAQLLERVGQLCHHIRLSGPIPREDLRREAFMARQIRQALDEFPGPILVITGGFHTSGLAERLEARGLGLEARGLRLEARDLRLVELDSSDAFDGDLDVEESLEARDLGLVESDSSNAFADDFDASGNDSQAPSPKPQAPSPKSQAPSPKSQAPSPKPQASGDDSQASSLKPQASQTGIALTPYADARLDGLSGYEAGMPSPGFYAQVWRDRTEGRGESYRQLLAAAVAELRGRGQIASTADLIAVETSARALAALRGHAEVWRRDLIDAIIGALIKEAVAPGTSHPFLEALLAVFRGAGRGRLAEGTSLPPLVEDIRSQLREHGLEPGQRERSVRLDLHAPEGLARSRVLHRLRLLAIPGFERSGGADLLAREDLSDLWEEWRIVWQPEQDAGCIEAAIYGATLADAAGARLDEQARAAERSAALAARLLLDACLIGLGPQADELFARLHALIREDSDFYAVAGALGHLLYLYRYDEALGATGRGDIGALLAETFRRTLWLLEALGQPQGHERELLAGLSALVQTYERCAAPLALDGAVLAEVLERVGADPGQHPLTRGGAVGALWVLGVADAARVRSDLRASAAPEHLGDFLNGLFALARETVQRDPELVLGIDALLMGYDDDAYLRALPALRLAFSFFTPREKHHLARTLLETVGQAGAMPDLWIDATTAARALALERRLLDELARYGIRGGGR
ncbi:MAG: hypothetical protein OHK0022_59050 [Roseiflexaceae bacterium]